jgi:hypothetical protein
MCVTTLFYAFGMGTSTLDTELKNAVRTLQHFVHTTSPGSISGDDALALVALLGEAERAAASGIALLSPVVVESGSYAKAGHASAPDWLGAVSGSSAGAAKGRLGAAQHAARSPELAGALHDAQLSADQLKIVAKVMAVAPEAPGALLSLVEDGASNQELRDAAARLKAEARSVECDRARRARVHTNRHFHWHQDPEGGVRGGFFCDEVAWATVAPRLEAEAKARWKAAGSAEGESLDAHRLDAFLEIMGCADGATGGSGPRARAVVLIDATALRRGTTKGDELCEIEGVGPVSVEAATELLGEASLQFVIKDGVDIATVTGSTRAIAQRIETALVVRDRTCVVPHCGKRLGLESDHRQVDYGDHGPTELANLVRLCPEHHDLKTQRAVPLAARLNCATHKMLYFAGLASTRRSGSPAGAGGKLVKGLKNLCGPPHLVSLPIGELNQDLSID